MLVAVGIAIRELRTEKAMSQEELALRAELDRTYVGNVERGQSNVALLTLDRIAKGLDTSLIQLLARAGLH
ncbi:transcriptional regulator [Massilia sp. YMA4]|nr:transcriptional regulator [Massilia sp. YMA4]